MLIPVMTGTILVAGFRLPHAKNVTNDSRARFESDGDTCLKVQILYNHDYYFSLVSCHPVVLLPCVKKPSINKPHWLWSKSLKSLVFRALIFTSPCLSTFPPFPRRIPYAHDIWYIPQLVLLCVLFVPTDYPSLIPPSLLGQLLFSLQSPSEASSPMEAFSDFFSHQQ